MNHRKLIAQFCLIGATAAVVSTAAQAQNMWAANQAFDQQFQARLSAMQQQNTNAQQQILQNYLRQYGPWLQQQYAQYRTQGGTGTFEQFAYYNLMTANGTNIQGGLDAQRRQYEGNRVANETVKSGHADYNAAWNDNQARVSAAANNYSNGAIRGTATYVDPQTGASRQLPYYSAPGQVQNSGGNYYTQDQQGTYWQWNGNSWSRMNNGW
jgi:hypothetical protein